jgi:uncharacterized protein
MRKFLLYIFLIGVLPLVQQVAAQNIPARPLPPKLVNDFTNTLAVNEVASLEAQLVALDDSSSNQIAVVIVPTLDDYPIEEYAHKLFRTWGIGDKVKNNGILLLIALNDKKIRIEVGKGLEGAIPDITADKIIRNELAPYFKQQRFYDGIDHTIRILSLAAVGEYKEARAKQRPSGSSLGPFAAIGLVVIVIIIVIVASSMRGGGGGFMSRRGYRGFDGGLPPIWFGGGGFGGGSSSGSDFGGGFGGFGGGDSGGGGASGGW